jgi:glutaconate CoA-transferase subunit A
MVPTAELAGLNLQNLRISRLIVDGVVEAPRGAGFTDCAPDYGRDEAEQRAYAEDAMKYLAGGK